MPYEELSPERAREALAALGVDVAPADVRPEAREKRWMVRLPGGRLAWFAADEEGRATMATERRVLRVLEARCGFVAPRVLATSPEGDAEVRTMVPGRAEPHWIFPRVRDEPEVAARVGAGLGAVLAELHTQVVAEDVAGWLPRRPAWPEPRAWIAGRLPRVLAAVDGAAELIARADEVMARCEAVLAGVAEADRALAHTDLGVHNLGIDEASLAVSGVFDWEAACWADRHLDFRYFLFGVDRFDLLEAALAVYEPAVGRALSRGRIVLYNAACAVSYLAFRDGAAPDAIWCGRTLDEDLGWTRWAVARALAVPPGEL